MDKNVWTTRGTTLIISTIVVFIWTIQIVNSDDGFVTVINPTNCSLKQDCILNCSFDSSKGWDFKSSITWTTKNQEQIYVYYNNQDQHTDQLPQYKNRTELFISEIKNGNASLLLRDVQQNDSEIIFICKINGPKNIGSGTTTLYVLTTTTTTTTTTPPSLTVANKNQQTFIGLILGLCFTILFIFLCILGSCYYKKKYCLHVL
ncbi:protein ORF40 [Lake sturgeon herpesvirus]|nr:protein ORF40 [Lake sturgeon herpesvirus]